MEDIRNRIKHADLYELRMLLQDWQGFFGVSEVEMKLNTVQTRKKALELIGMIGKANKLGETTQSAAVSKTSSPEQVWEAAFKASERRREDLIEEIRSTERERTAVTKEKRSWLWRLFFSDGVEDEGVEKVDEEEEEKEKENEESKMG